MFVARSARTAASWSGFLVSSHSPCDVTFGTVSTAGTFASGIDAESAGNVTVTGGNVSTSAVDAPAIYAFSDTGNASVTTTGTVATTGASSRGIYAYSNTGDATVAANNVTTTGDNGDAILATGANASVTVSGTVSTQGTRAYSNSNANAIKVDATDGVATVVNNGTVTTAGDNATEDMMTKILVSEEEHTDWLEAQLELMRVVGEQNYLSQQIKKS